MTARHVSQCRVIVINRLGASDEVTGLMRLVTATGLRSTYADAGAGLAMVIHMGLPAFMNGNA